MSCRWSKADRLSRRCSLAMSHEYEWAVYDKRELSLNEQQLLAIGARSFRNRENDLSPNIRILRSSMSLFLVNQLGKTILLRMLMPS